MYIKERRGEEKFFKDTKLELTYLPYGKYNNKANSSTKLWKLVDTYFLVDGSKAALLL